MFNFKPFLILTFRLAHFSTAHFIVNTPPPLGNDISNESVAPCGGFTPSNTTTLTDFHVAGDAISLTTLHAQAYFAYRGMVGLTLTQPNWTILLPTIEEFGLNSFCEPSVAVPETWAGESGLLQVIQDAEDGVHYQCIPVNFVAGVASSPSSSACSNSSGVSAIFASDSVLSGAESGTSSSSSGSSSVASSTQATASSTSSAQASPSTSKSGALPTFRSELVTNWLFVGLLAIILTIWA